MKSNDGSFENYRIIMRVPWKTTIESNCVIVFYRLFLAEQQQSTALQIGDSILVDDRSGTFNATVVGRTRSRKGESGGDTIRVLCEGKVGGGNPVKAIQETQNRYMNSCLEWCGMEKEILPLSKESTLIDYPYDIE